MDKKFIFLFVVIIFLSIQSLSAKQYNVTVGENIKFSDNLEAYKKDVSAERDYNEFIRKITIDVFLIGLWLVFFGYCLSYAGKGFFKNKKHFLVFLLWLILTFIIFLIVMVMHNRIIAYLT